MGATSWIGATWELLGGSCSVSDDVVIRGLPLGAIGELDGILEEVSGCGALIASSASFM